MPGHGKAKAIGFNHVALEVGDLEEALAFYGRLFEFKLRGSAGTYRLREELIARANLAAAPARINDILFTQMLIQ